MSISRFFLRIFFIVKSMGRGAFETYIAIAAALLLIVSMVACGGGGAEDFAPKPHNDSGGGAERFLVKGGDNTVQEFGAEASPAEFEEAAAALHNFLDARVERNWSAACTYLDRKLTKSLEEFESAYQRSPTCAGGLKRSTNPRIMGELRDEAAQADVFSLRAENVLGFLIFRATPHNVRVMSMNRDGGHWKVDSLTAISLSPSPEEEAGRKAAQ